VVRLVGEQESKEMPTVGADELVAEGVRLRGHLVGGAEPAVPLGWRTVIGENNLGIIATQGVEIQFAPRPNETAESPAAGFVELRRGDRLPGELVMMDADGVRFRGDVSGEVLVPVEEVSRIRLGRPGKLDDADLDLLLSLPRRMKDSPPTHMLVSSSGDLLRGRLTSIDGQEARLEIRGKTRVIERAKISEVVWLGQKTAPSAECRYVVATRDGARLGLGTAKLQAAELRGTHEVFGECRLPTQTLTTLTFGPRQDSQRERWELVPVKEPRSFE